MASKTFSEQLRELFPESRMVCYCHRELVVCPGNCTNLKKAREDIRAWAEKCDE